MRAVSHDWALLMAIPAVVVACDGGGGSSSAASSDEGDEDCRFTTTVSGGLQAELTGQSAICAYTSRAISLTEIGGDGVVLIVSFERDLQPLQTGTFDATIEVHREHERWVGAQCRVDIASNVKRPSRVDASISFDSYLLKGSGTCSTPATYRGDAGATAPVAIAPFTFSLYALFY